MPRAKSAPSHRRHALAPVAAAALAKHAPATETTSAPSPSSSKVELEPKPRPAGAAPYSKSHVKREKRKRQQLGGGLGSIASALEAVVAVEEEAVVVSKGGKGVKPKVVGAGKVRSEDDGKIGEGKGHGLKERQRRKLLTANAARIPAVMAHPAFKANPWATIREHAGNSLAVAPEVEAVAERKRLDAQKEGAREIVRLRGSDGSGMEVE